MCRISGLYIVMQSVCSQTDFLFYGGIILKALVLLSGGVDSTTCLAVAKEKYSEVIALALYYGQKHSKELAAAEKIAAYYNTQLIKLDLTPVFAYSNCSLLQQSTEEIPHESYAGQIKKQHGEPVSTYVPFRNGVFLSVAASIALAQNCSVVYYLSLIHI